MRHSHLFILIAAAHCAATAHAQDLAFLGIIPASDHTALILVYDGGRVYQVELSPSDEAYGDLPECLGSFYQANLDIYTPYDFDALTSGTPATMVDARELARRAEETKAGALQYEVYDLAVQHGGGSCYLAAEHDQNGVTRLRALEIRSSVLNIFVADEALSNTLQWLRNLTARLLPGADSTR